MNADWTVLIITQSFHIPPPPQFFQRPLPTGGGVTTLPPEGGISTDPSHSVPAEGGVATPTPPDHSYSWADTTNLVKWWVLCAPLSHLPSSSHFGTSIESRRCGACSISLWSSREAYSWRLWQFPSLSCSSSKSYKEKKQWVEIYAGKNIFAIEYSCVRI